jgi:hypothetical protein
MKFATVFLTNYIRRCNLFVWSVIDPEKKFNNIDIRSAAPCVLFFDELVKYSFNFSEIFVEKSIL